MTEDLDAACKNLEQWLGILTKKNYEIAAAARGDIGSLLDKETGEQNISHHSKSESDMISSKRSSQHQLESKIKT